MHRTIHNYHLYNFKMIHPYCIAQRTLLGALWWPKWEGNPREGRHVYVWLIHFAVQWKLMQHCKATLLQQKLLEIQAWYLRHWPFREHSRKRQLPWLPSDEESAWNAGTKGDKGSVPGLGRSTGAGHGNPLQYSCLENPMDRRAWRATAHGVAKIQTLKWLSRHVCI